MLARSAPPLRKVARPEIVEWMTYNTCGCPEELLVLLCRQSRGAATTHVAQYNTRKACRMSCPASLVCVTLHACHRAPDPQHVPFLAALAPHMVWGLMAVTSWMHPMIVYAPGIYVSCIRSSGLPPSRSSCHRRLSSIRPAHLLDTCARCNCAMGPSHSSRLETSPCASPVRKM